MTQPSPGSDQAQPDSLAKVAQELREDYPFASHGMNEFAAVLDWADRIERLDAEMRARFDCQVEIVDQVTQLDLDEKFRTARLIAELRARLAECDGKVFERDSTK
jgi:hypothetical protein